MSLRGIFYMRSAKPNFQLKHLPDFDLKCNSSPVWGTNDISEGKDGWGSRRMVEIILCCSCSGTGSGHSVKKKKSQLFLAYTLVV